MIDVIVQKKRILMLDDDADTRNIFAEALQRYFFVDTTGDIDFAYNSALENKYDLLILDFDLGQKTTGLDLCKKIRAQVSTQRLPIVILTGQGQKDIQINSYDVGADDYFDKSDDIDIIAASLTGKIKRIEGIVGKSDALGNLVVYSERSEIEINNNIHKLSKLELSILKLFIKNVNRPIGREEIRSSVWKEMGSDNRLVDVHISNLRRKLSEFDHEFEPQYGKGYMLKPSKSKK